MCFCVLSVGRSVAGLTFPHHREFTFAFVDGLIICVIFMRVTQPLLFFHFQMILRINRARNLAQMHHYIREMESALLAKLVIASIDISCHHRETETYHQFPQFARLPAFVRVMRFMRARECAHDHHISSSFFENKTVKKIQNNNKEKRKRR